MVVLVNSGDGSVGDSGGGVLRVYNV
jgi:hypothetical protein